jgi:hypothetical protein
VRVPRLHEGDVSTPAEVCVECGLPHSQARRLAVLRRMLPATAEDVADAWPHLWPRLEGGAAPSRMLNRDMHALGAVRGADGVWRLP